MAQKLILSLFLLAYITEGADDARIIQMKNSCSKDGWIIVTDGYGSEHEVLPTYRLNASQTVNFSWSAPYVNNNIWSGNFGICLDGTCQDDDSLLSCDNGGCFISENGPMSRAEFTIQSTGSDYYDISIINGANVPISITPYGKLSHQDNDPYWCGNPGGKIPMTLNGSTSNWIFNPPYPEYYRWVLHGGEKCNNDNDCDIENNEICGLSNNIGETPQFYTSCGLSNLGYWTADQVCGNDITVGYPFNCSQSMSNGPSDDTTMWTYLGCINGISSCYQSNAPSSCCGCFDWWEMENISVPSSPLTQSCVNKNIEWQNTAGLTLKFLKEACPSCYTYPYDDMSSTFLCNSGTDVNTVDYIVEFCPV